MTITTWPLHQHTYYIGLITPSPQSSTFLPVTLLHVSNNILLAAQIKHLTEIFPFSTWPACHNNNDNKCVYME